MSFNPFPKQKACLYYLTESKSIKFIGYGGQHKHKVYKLFNYYLFMFRWKYIKDTNQNYMISNCGRLKTLNWKNTGKEKIMKPAIDNRGYLRTAIIINGKLKTVKIHRLVAEAFIPNPENKPQVNHIDFNKQNNNVSNLEWVTAKENHNHSYKTGRIKMCSPYNKTTKRGVLNGCSKLNDKQVLEIRKKFKPRIYTRKMLADEYNVKECTIKDIILRKSWRHI